MSGKPPIVSVEKMSQGEWIIRLHRMFEFSDYRVYENTLGKIIADEGSLVTLDLSALDSINVLTLTKIIDFEGSLNQNGKNLLIRDGSDEPGSLFKFLQAGRLIRRLRPS